MFIYILYKCGKSAHMFYKCRILISNAIVIIQKTHTHTRIENTYRNLFKFIICLLLNVDVESNWKFSFIKNHAKSSITCSTYTHFIFVKKNYSSAWAHWNVKKKFKKRSRKKLVKNFKISNQFMIFIFCFRFVFYF